MKVGFIGIGKMGAPMVGRLAKAGHQVTIHNRTAAKAQALAGPSVAVATSPAEVAAASDVVLTALPTAETVDAVYRELAGVARTGQGFADHSTVGLDLTRRIASSLVGKGAYFCDAPVSGGPAGAKSGTLTVMVGGAQADLDRLKPVFEAFGQTIALCGPTGTGQAVKLVNQLLVALHTAAISEAAVFGAKLGADPQIVLDVIGASFGASRMLSRHMPRFISRDFSPATPVALILKDLGLIRGEAEKAGVPMRLESIVEGMFSEAVGRGLGDQDMAALVRLVEEASRVEVRSTVAAKPGSG
ncbi:MAG: NAD(P)-dependent oxidoreductase [Chloroflexi bacterium]|nr:NAD(P)-dependent oxidoreductase [Chloroflexota bacterium]